MNIYAEALKLMEHCEAFAVATIISSEGSTPRSSAKMIVKSGGGILGTIGGGPLEAFVIEEAVSAVKEGRSRVVEYILDSRAANGIQMLCGGKIGIFIEVISVKPRIMIIGGGHVGKAVSEMAGFLDYTLAVIDDREEFANNRRYPTASEISWDTDIVKAIGKLKIDANTYIVIATKDSDLAALKAVILSDAAYIGMIGSRRKKAIVFERLMQEGISRERIDFVHAPVGLDLGAETPEEIAVSIMAEILKICNNRSGTSLKEIKK